MQEGRYAPLVSQAEITGKVHPDLRDFAHRKYMAGQTEYMQRAYAASDHKENFAIMPGELLVGYKKRNTHSRTHEIGFSSVALMEYGETPEGKMRKMYFLGVAKGEYQPDGDSMFNQDPMDHGLGSLRSGSITVNNNSPQDFNAGDILCWRLPPTPGGDPRTQGMGGVGRSLDTGLNPRVSYNRTGTPFGKPLIQLERFDATDFSFQLAGAYALFDKPSTQGGIKDLGPEVLFGDKTNLTSLQEEALGWKWGLLMIGALMRPGQDGEDFFQTAIDQAKVGELPGPNQDDFLNRCFLRNVMPGSNTRTIGAFGNFSNLKVGQFKFYQDHLFHMLAGGVAGAWHSKASRIVGKAMSSGKSTKSFDLMVSHFKVF